MHRVTRRLQEVLERLQDPASSRPQMSGSSTSRMRHAGTFRRRWPRYSEAFGNSTTSKPADAGSASSDSRTRKSSSTTYTAFPWDGSRSPHRLHAVARQVHQHLLDLHAIGQGRRQIVLELRHDARSGATPRRQSVDSPRRSLLSGPGRRARAPSPEQGPHPAHHVGRRFGVTDHPLDGRHAATHGPANIQPLGTGTHARRPDQGHRDTAIAQELARRCSGLTAPPVPLPSSIA